MEHLDATVQYLQNIGYKGEWSKLLRFDQSIVMTCHTEPNPYKGTARPFDKVQITVTIPEELVDGTAVRIDYLDCNGVAAEQDGWLVPENTMLNQVLGHYSNLLRTIGELAAEDSWNMSEGIPINVPDAETAWEFALGTFDHKVTCLADGPMPYGFAFHYHQTINTLREHRELRKRLEQNSLGMAD